MAVKRKGLGRGLDSLFINTDVSIDNLKENNEIDGLEIISIDKIKRNKNQPRKVFDEEKIEDLANSIKEHGVIQPIILRKSGENFEIVAGERRWRAARKAGLDKVPAIIRKLTEEQNMLFAIIENMQRENLNPIEEAEGIESMIKTFSLTQEEVAKSLGKSRPYITNSMRLLKLPREIKDMLSRGEISIGHSRALINIGDEEKQIEIAKSIVEKGLTVRDIENIGQNKKRYKGKPAKRKPKGSDIIAVEKELKEILGTKVIIENNNKYSTIQIECYNAEELNRIIDVLRKI